MLDIAGFFFVAVSVLGNVGVNLKRRWGQALWIAANVFWIGFNLHIESYSQALLFTIYLGLAIWGWITWKEGKHEANP